MPTYNFTGFAPDAFDTISGGGLSATGGEFRLDPNWDAQDNGYNFEFTDDDAFIDGDGSNNEVGNDANQTLVVRDPSGTVVASGQTYIEEAARFTNEYGNTVYLYKVEIAGQHVGYVIEGHIQPGNTYTVDNVFDPDGWAEYTYTDSETYDQDASNSTRTSDSSDSIEGGQGHDYITDGDSDAADGNDTINAGQGNDTVLAGSGDDSIDGGDGNDSIHGGDGNDVISASDGFNTLIGGAGDDTITGGTSSDLIYGDEVDDTATIDTGNYSSTGNGYTVTARNVVNGAHTSASSSNVGVFGNGFGANGTISDSDSGVAAQTGYDKASGLSEELIVTFDNDIDTLSFSFENLYTADFGEVGHWAVYDNGVLVAEGDFTEGTPSSGSGTVNINGVGSFDQIIFTGKLQTDGSDGSDFGITSVDFPGPVTVGNDSLSGGAGQDTIYGGAGDDSIDGGDGNDYLDDGAGNDTVHGGAGNDTIDSESTGSGADSLSGGSGDDVIWAGDGADTLQGGTGSDTLYGEDDADTFVFADGFGNDTVYGGESGTDFDEIDLSALSGPVTVTYTGDESGTITDGTNTIAFSGIEKLTLTEYDDEVDASLDGVGVNIDAGGGQDSILGGSGNDTISGGADSDIIRGEDGNDVLDGGSGNDYIFSGDGQDTIYGGTGHDTVDAGANGKKTIYGEDGNDSILGSTGSDTISGGAGDDTITGWVGNDSIDGDAGNDSITGSTGSDTISGGADNDTIQGWSGNDLIDGGTGSDSLSGDDGNDTITGGSGDDTLDGGTGFDSLTGGDGNDTFVYNVGDNNDTITDFGFGNTGGTDDGDQSNNDYINLAGFYDHLSELKADQEDDGILNQSNTTDTKGNATDYSDNDQFGSGSLTMQGASSSDYTYDNTNVVCFTPGALILTPSGDVPVERLAVGDRVVTLDNGPQKIRWIGARVVTEAELRTHPNIRPILIKAGCFGATADLCVSPQHGVVLAGDGVQLVRAKHLMEIPNSGARIAHGKRRVTYIHLMFEDHQIIFANGMASESFYPGPTALRALSDDALREMLTLFPSLHPDGSGTTDVSAAYGDRARPLIPAKTVRKQFKGFQSKARKPRIVFLGQRHNAAAAQQLHAVGRPF